MKAEDLENFVKKQIEMKDDKNNKISSVSIKKNEEEKEEIKNNNESPNKNNYNIEILQNDIPNRENDNNNTCINNSFLGTENNNISILSHQLDNSFSRILDKPKKKSLVLQHSILGNIKEDLFCDTPTTIPKIKNEIHLPPLPNFNIPQYKDEQIIYESIKMENFNNFKEEN